MRALIPFVVLTTLVACKTPEKGDPCVEDADCGDELVCHLEPGAEEGVCDDCHHDDEDCAHDHEGEDHDHEE
jgi:hypothetical protein